jgi:uncharacterized flavoprotein (TIGR03862 family)
VDLRTRSRWLGWDDDGALAFDGPEGRETARPDATLLALGGASWPGLGSDGAWAAILADQGVKLTPFSAANSGFVTPWSEVFRTRFAGCPLKAIAVTFGETTVRGEAMIAGYGLEGGAIYALSARLREAIARDGSALVHIDLRPDLTAGEITARLARGPKGASVSTALRKALALTPAAVNLLREAHGLDLPAGASALARAVKAAPVRLTGTAPLARAISTAGGIKLSDVDESLRLRGRDKVFAAGEMLDWEAPTGGYLLQATLATGAAAARAMLAEFS